MPIAEFTQISIGRDSDVFKRFKITKETERYREQLSVTIYAEKRTLDLEATSAQELANFLRQLNIVKSFIQDEEQEDSKKNSFEDELKASENFNVNQEGAAGNEILAEEPQLMTMGFEGRPVGSQ